MQSRHHGTLAPRPGSRLVRLQSGFTLVELMVTITVMAILMAIAVPSFSDAMLGSKLRGYANNLVASTSLARGEAIKRNVQVTLCASANGTTCAASGGWEQGWIIQCKTTDNANCDASGPNWLVLQGQPAAAAGLKITEASALLSVVFDPSGVGATTATMTVCRATPTGSQERVVSITATGRASVKKTTAGTCT